MNITIRSLAVRQLLVVALFSLPVWPDDIPRIATTAPLPSQAVPKKAEKKHPLRKILGPARRAIEKYGTPNPGLQGPNTQVLPTQAPEMPPLPSPQLPPKPSWIDRLMSWAVRTMTTTWDNNIFVWLPALSTDPNTGPTVGVLPVLVLAEKEHHHIQHLLAPSYTYNSLFGQTGTMRYYFYPSDESQLFTIASFSQHTNREIKVRFQDNAFLGGRASVRAEGLYQHDGSPRFFGIGAGTHAGDEAGYVAKETGARGEMGINFFRSWRASLGLRFRNMGIDPNITPNISDLATRFGSVNGVNGQNTVSNEFRLLWDSRDLPITPSRGSSGELVIEKTSLALGSDSDYWRYSLEGKKFFLWKNPKQVTVVHGLYEWVNGPQIPFYELARLGGRETLRGYGDGRFTDRGRLVFNLEQRITVASQSLMGVQTNFELAPFFDIGTVFPTLPQIQRKTFTPVYGAAFRAAVKPNVVGDVEVGIGKEGAAVFVDINYPF